MYIDSYEQMELATEKLNDLVGILISDIEDQINQYNDSPFDTCPLTATWLSNGYMGCCPDPAI